MKDLSFRKYYISSKTARVLTAVFLPIVCVSLLAFIYFGNPVKNAFIPCLFHYVTNLDCPGCGMTRALYSLLHFRFLQAFMYNPIIYILVPAAIYCSAAFYIYLLTGKWHTVKIKIQKPVLITFIIVLLAFYILRNFPVAPFSYFKV